jgi:hypothetical protein
LRAVRALAAAAIGTLIVVALMLSACSRSVRVDFTADAGSMTTAEVESLAKGVDLAPVEGISVADAPDVRTDALVWLRGQGAVGDRAATLLTVGFPDRTAAVPLIVSAARVDGVRSLVAVEAFGGDSGPLSYRRLWIFDYETGALLSSASYR